MKYTLWRNGELLGGIESASPADEMIGGFFQTTSGFEPTQTVQQMRIAAEYGSGWIHILMARNVTSEADVSGIAVEPSEVLEVRDETGAVVPADMISLWALPDVPSTDVRPEMRESVASNRWFLSFGSPDVEAPEAT
jgi:hypothetical protein